MLKNFIKRNLAPDTWMRLKSYKRNFDSLSTKSELDARLKDEKKILILGVADYENLGDHAIAKAQRDFLDATIGTDHEYKILEISSRTPIRHVKEIINNDDIILFTGGGNLGTKYGFMYDIFLPILKAFPNNKKLIFPQSYTFNETDPAKTIEKIKHVFAANGENLTLAVRESKSLKLFSEMFPENKIIFVPDIVLSLKPELEPNENANGILMLMRDSGEKVLDEAVQDELISRMSESYKVTVNENTNLPDVSINEREHVLMSEFEKINNHEVVITDRLHGMIFAHITGKPCIVFDNYNSKIKMTYKDWLKDKESIVFVDPRGNIDLSQFDTYIDNLRKSTVEPFDVTQKYAPLKQSIIDLFD